MRIGGYTLIDLSEVDFTVSEDPVAYTGTKKGIYELIKSTHKRLVFSGLPVVHGDLAATLVGVEEGIISVVIGTVFLLSVDSSDNIAIMSYDEYIAENVTATMQDAGYIPPNPEYPFTPPAPAVDGTYTYKAIVADGGETVTYDWVLDQ